MKAWSQLNPGQFPIVKASFATTMHRLTAGRLTLGIGRGIDAYQKALGMPSVTTPCVSRTNPCAAHRLHR